MPQTITVNGEPREIAPETPVSKLLVDLDLADRPCAVEVNRDIVPKAMHTEHRLAAGDVVEIVTLVGGG